MRALVLSGGGAKGAYEAGLISSLVHEYREDFDIFCGTSIGAINAAFLAQEKIDALSEMWQSIHSHNIVTPFPRVQALRDTFSAFVGAHERKGLSHTLALIAAFVQLVRMLPLLHPLKALATLTGAIDPTPTQKLLSTHLRLSDVKRVLITTATDLTSQTEEVFYYFPERYAELQTHFVERHPGSEAFNETDFTEIIRASGAIPGAFSPVTFSHVKPCPNYVDGGVVNNTPIGLAIDAGATDITVVYLDPTPSKATVIDPNITIPGILLSCFGIMQQRLLALDHQLALEVNDAVEATSIPTPGKRVVSLRTFRPNNPLAVGVIDFHRQDLIDQAYFQGQRDARDPEQRQSFQTSKRKPKITTQRFEGQVEDSRTKQTS